MDFVYLRDGMYAYRRFEERLQMHLEAMRIAEAMCTACDISGIERTTLQIKYT